MFPKSAAEPLAAAHTNPTIVAADSAAEFVK
jgi:hypothetical protein